MPNQDDQNQTKNPISVISPQADLPPMPPAFQSAETTSSASGAPEEKSNQTPSIPPVISSTPKKKYGGGRIIATLLGILLLVGGVGAGLVLTRQQQLFQQKAGTNDECTTSGDCPSGYVCQGVPKQCVTTKECNPGSTSYCEIDMGTKNCPGTRTCGAAGHWSSCKDIPNDGCSTCTPNCDGVTCGRANGCGGICAPGSGCTNPEPPPPSTCNSTNCVFPKYCSGTSCVYASNASCGRDADPNAPVCCPPAYTSCPGGDISCEPPKRRECKIGTKYCTINTPEKTCGGTNTPNPPTPTPPPSGSITASCQKVTAYNSSWAALTDTQLSKQKPGTTINFCVNGTTNGGKFDKARFIINGNAQADTTTHRPNSTDYCQAYAIPEDVTSFVVKARIHHTTLGWSDL